VIRDVLFVTAFIGALTSTALPCVVLGADSGGSIDARLFLAKVEGKVAAAALILGRGSSIHFFGVAQTETTRRKELARRRWTQRKSPPTGTSGVRAWLAERHLRA
jgi:hypothetical protein